MKLFLYPLIFDEVISRSGKNNELQINLKLTPNVSIIGNLVH